MRGATGGGAAQQASLHAHTCAWDALAHSQPYVWLCAHPQPPTHHADVDRGCVGGQDAVGAARALQVCEWGGRLCVRVCVCVCVRVCVYTCVHMCVGGG